MVGTQGSLDSLYALCMCKSSTEQNGGEIYMVSLEAKAPGAGIRVGMIGDGSHLWNHINHTISDGSIWIQINSKF